MELNEAQQKAVEHKNGPMMVLAGPGSGKTRVITHRIRFLVEKCGIDPANILVITFTKAAAMEMRRRYLQMGGRGGSAIWFGTFHAIFFTILKHAYHYTAGNIIRDEVRRQLLTEIVEHTDVEVQDMNEFVNDIGGQISLIKGSRMNVEHYYSPICPNDAFRHIFEQYRQALMRKRLIDFDDMLVYCYELLDQRPDIRSAWQKQFPYILIDEFQDINQVQYDVVKLLAAPKNNLFIVGDDDQSIYGFRGAKPDIMQSFERDFQPERCVLDINYRSRPEIIRAAGKVIRHNKNRLEKTILSVAEASRKEGDVPGAEASLTEKEGLVAKDALVKIKDSELENILTEREGSGSKGALTKKEGFGSKDTSTEKEGSESKIALTKKESPGPKAVLMGMNAVETGFSDIVQIREFEHQKQQNETIRRLILEKHERGLPYREMAILFRTNRQAGAITSKLKEYNIPFFMKEAIPNLYEHWAVRDVLTYIRVAMGNRERGNLLRIINRPKRYVHRAAFSEPVVDLEDLKDYYEDKDWMVERIEDFQEDLMMLCDMRPYAAVNYIRRGIGYDDYIREYCEERGIRTDELYELLDELQDEAGNHKDFEEWFQYIADYGEELKKQVEKSRQARNGKESDEDAVMIITMHGAKGLEFDTVFLPEANEGSTPHNKATLTEDMEEERRMFYVAITRAKNQLYIFYLKERFSKEVSPSRFVEEMLEE